MSFSSRRRNYLLTPHRRDGLIEWMKSMLQHSFVLDSLETTAADTFEHFEVLIEEHRERQDNPHQPSRLQQLVPTIGTFHTHLPLRAAFQVYNEKTRVTKRKHIQISFNEIRHILNLAQIMELCQMAGANDISARLLDSAAELEQATAVPVVDQSKQPTTPATTDDTTKMPFKGPKLISFDGDQTLYSDGANFESNPRLAHYLYQLLKHGVTVAVVTAAGYEYQVEKYEYRLSGLLRYFSTTGLTPAECARFFLMGGECNYLLQLGPDYRLHAVQEHGPGGWCTATRFLKDSPDNWSDEQIAALLDLAQETLECTCDELNLRARVIRKRRSVGLVPQQLGQLIPRESLDEAVLRVHEKSQKMNKGAGPTLPYCAFNGGADAWVDVGNKRVGVQVLQTYVGIGTVETLHIGDQFLNNGNDYAARAVSPCVWITSPQETTYILKSILRLAGVDHTLEETDTGSSDHDGRQEDPDDTVVDAATAGGELLSDTSRRHSLNFAEVERRARAAQQMDVYTGEMISQQ